jgi:hypothetical protein
MTWVNIPSTFIKIKNHLNYFWSIFVFLSTQVHYICFHKYTPISHFIKWNKNNNLFLKLYSNIICKNIVKIFQKFEVGYIQTCTSLESSIMWHPDGGHYSVLSPHVFENDYKLRSHNCNHILSFVCLYSYKW